MKDWEDIIRRNRPPENPVPEKKRMDSEAERLYREALEDLNRSVWDDLGRVQKFQYNYTAQERYSSSPYERFNYRYRDVSRFDFGIELAFYYMQAGEGKNRIRKNAVRIFETDPIPSRGVEQVNFYIFNCDLPQEKRYHSNTAYEEGSMREALAQAWRGRPVGFPPAIYDSYNGQNMFHGAYSLWVYGDADLGSKSDTLYERIRYGLALNTEMRVVRSLLPQDFQKKGMQLIKPGE